MPSPQRSSMRQRLCRSSPAALVAAPSGNGGRLLAVESLLWIRHDLDACAPALALLHLPPR